MILFRVVVTLLVVFQGVSGLQCMDQSGLHRSSFNRGCVFSNYEKERIQLIAHNIPVVLARGCDVLDLNIKSEIRDCIDLLATQHNMVQEDSEIEFESAQDLAAQVFDGSFAGCKKTIDRIAGSQCDKVTDLFEFTELLDTVTDSLESRIIKDTAPVLREGLRKIIKQEIADINSVQDRRFQFAVKNAPWFWYKKESDTWEKSKKDELLALMIDELRNERDKNKLAAKKDAARLMFNFAFDPYGDVQGLYGAAKRSFLTYAFDRRCLPLIEVLLSCGVDVNKIDRLGVDPLLRVVGSSFFSSYRGSEREKTTKLLIDAGARLDRVYGANRHNVLDEAVRSNCPSVNAIKVLLHAGVDSNGTDIYGQTPLHVAVGIKDGDEIVKELLKYSADFNLKDQDGNTPLHKAFMTSAYRSAGKSAALLIAAGADETVLNNQGLSPMVLSDTTSNPSERRVERTAMFLDAIKNRDNRASLQSASLEDSMNVVQGANNFSVQSKKRKRE